jgi:hypothetical protein
MTGFFGFVRTSEHRRVVEGDPDGPQLGGERRAKRSASFSSPLRPSVSIGGHSVNGRLQSRDPAALLIHAHPERHVARQRLRLAREIGDLRGLGDVACEQMMPPRSNSRASRLRSAGMVWPGEPRDLEAARRGGGRTSADDYNVPCTSTPPPRRGSTSRAARSTSGRSTSFTKGPRRSTRRSACGRGAPSVLGPQRTGAPVIVSEDTGARVEARHWSELRDNAELRCSGGSCTTSRPTASSCTRGASRRSAPASPDRRR